MERVKPSAPGPVHLILGEEEFLAERARIAVTTAVRESLPEGTELPVTTMRAGDVNANELAELLSPSLFGEDRVLILTGTQDAGKDAADLILSAAGSPAPGIYLIILHTGAGRTKAMVPKLSKLAEVHRADKIKPSERPAFVNQEFRNHGVRVTSDVTRALLEGVGSDLRELASAVSQLVADTGGEVTEAKVREYYVGVAEVSGFDIADLACSGQVQRAVASTRRALQLGLSPVMLAAALSTTVGSIARLYSTRGRVDANSLARVVGMPPWKVEKTARLARTWNGEAVSEAVIIVADLDAAVKGQAADDGYAIEHAVRRIAELAG